MDRVDYQSLIIQDLINDNKEKKLDLNPWYQRRSVWSKSQKAYLLNTLFERKPIPAIYVRHTIDLENERSIKEVVDGQQRSRAIIEYCAGEFAARTASGDRKEFQSLSKHERERLLLTPLPVGYLLGASDEDVIDIFGRINSASKTLNSQEKRNSKFSGEFKQFCLNVSTSNLKFWRNTNIFSANDIARMIEVQFVADLVLNMINGISDFRPSALDNIYEENEDNFEMEEEISNRLSGILDHLFEIDSQTFRDTIFNRQPIFFSLVLALDEIGVIPDDLKEKIYDIDSEFRAEEIEYEELKRFRSAVASSTQRLSSRKTRHDFLVQWLSNG